MQTQLPANRIAELRRERGMKRYDIAAALRVDPSTVHRWENGGNITDEQKFKLAELFDVTVPYLMGWDQRSGEAA